jgi:hypothetical protein
MVYVPPQPHQGVEQHCLVSLTRSPYAAVRLLDCRVADDTATLSGTVPTYYTKQVALHIVSVIPGVNRIVDRIRVSFPDKLNQAQRPHFARWTG